MNKKLSSRVIVEQVVEVIGGLEGAMEIDCMVIGR